MLLGTVKDIRNVALILVFLTLGRREEKGLKGWMDYQVGEVGKARARPRGRWKKMSPRYRSSFKLEVEASSRKKWF